MSEDEIERRIEAHVERLFNALDRRLLRGELTQAEYDRQAARIADWADEQYRSWSGSASRCSTVELTGSFAYGDASTVMLASSPDPSKQENGRGVDLSRSLQRYSF